VAERETLIKIEDGGRVLVLLDGRRLEVSPQALPTSSQWPLMSDLEILEESADPLYPLKVRNLDRKEEILAMWR
jgi:hypothetical protein